MSAGPRLPLAAADQVAAHLMERWQMPRGECVAVGSVRRRRPDVGDIDLLAPLPAQGARDWLYERLADCCPAEGLLMQPREPWCRAELGLKPGFRHAKLVASLAVSGTPAEVPVGIYRYIPGAGGNMGWAMVQRTGPAEFGEWLLGAWKYRRGIGKDAPGSRDGEFLDEHGQVVATPTEESVFWLVGVPFVPPEERSEFLERRARRRSLQAEHLR